MTVARNCWVSNRTAQSPFCNLCLNRSGQWSMGTWNNKIKYRSFFVVIKFVRKIFSFHETLFYNLEQVHFRRNYCELQINSGYLPKYIFWSEGWWSKNAVNDATTTFSILMIITDTQDCTKYVQNLHNNKLLSKIN